jgi:thiamine biosynthesis protein ThiS
LIIIILLFIQLLYTMIKIKKIKIKLNGKVKSIEDNTKLSNLLRNLNIPIKKVAIEINQRIVDKKKLNKIILKKNDKVEIVHFIGGG